MWEWFCSIWSHKKDPKPPREPNGLVAEKSIKKESKGLMCKIKDKLLK
jgi:hypothetical protein